MVAPPSLMKFKRLPFSKRSLNLLPIHLLPVVGSLVSSTAAARKLLLWGRALPWQARSPQATHSGA